MMCDGSVSSCTLLLFNTITSKHVFPRFGPSRLGFLRLGLDSVSSSTEL